MYKVNRLHATLFYYNCYSSVSSVLLDEEIFSYLRCTSLLFMKTIFVSNSCLVVPHITNAIQEWVERVAQIPVDGDAEPPEVCIIEVKLTFHIVNTYMSGDVQ